MKAVACLSACRGPSSPWRLLAALVGVIWIACAIPATTTPALAQTEAQSHPAFGQRMTKWQETLDQAAGILGHGRMVEADYDALRGTLTQVFKEAREASADAADAVRTTRAMLDALGAPPAEDAPPEDKAVAAQRKELTVALSDVSGRVSQADLVATRADILLRTANERRLDQFTESLFRRGPSPIAAEVWAELPKQVEFTRDRLERALKAVGTARIAWLRHGAELLGAILVALGLGLVIRHLLRRHDQAQIHDGQAGDDQTGDDQTGGDRPSSRRRTIQAFVETLALGLLPTLVIAGTVFTLNDLLASLPGPTILRNALTAMAGGLGFMILAGSLGWAVLAPRRPAWRLLDVTDQQAHGLFIRTVLLALVLATSGAVLAFLELALVAPELHAVASFLAKATGMAAMLLLLGGAWRGAAAPKLRISGVLASIAVVMLSLLGFHNLGLYIAKLLVFGAGATGLLYMMRGIGQEMVHLATERPDGRMARWRQTLLPSEQERKIFVHVAAGLLDLLLLLAGAAVMLPLIGIKWSEIKAWSITFLHGVTIGEVTIAPLDILIALLLVIVVMAITRLIQRKLDEQVLERLSFDGGVRHSIRTGIGYLGAMIAVIAGIGALGLNLSNLAMIASALSVGIGFGLQAVVSNFVAGLILLVERPIKVGDWIVIGNREGVVKRISVRSTELQTFQHASVIIPNSELITGSVTNWTHKDKVGRLDLPVGVSHDSDPEKVRRILLDCAGTDARIAHTPAPIVIFRDFGDNALMFELRVFVADVSAFLSVGSDLRFAILQAFREHGIKIPLPQRVVHIVPSPAAKGANPGAQAIAGQPLQIIEPAL